jgi:hypothetical protein
LWAPQYGFANRDLGDTTMKARSRWLFLSALFLTALAVAPATSSATASIEVRRHLAGQVLEILHGERYFGRLLDVAFDGLPIVGAENFAGEVESEVDEDRLHEALEIILAENYSSEELLAMVEFYGSPMGRSILTKRPRILKQLNEIVQIELIRAIETVMERKRQ